MAPDAVEIIFPAHVLPAIGCIVLALIVLVLALTAGASNKKRRS